MIACFGLYDGYHESCFPADRLVENPLRLDAFKLNRIGAFAEGAVTRLKWGDHGGGAPARQTGTEYFDQREPRFWWFGTSRDGLGLNARRAAGGSPSPSDDHLHSYLLMLRTSLPTWRSAMTFKQGVSGNPHGNRHRTRHLLNQEFMQALLLHFRRHGKKAIEKVAREQPASYLKILGLLVPREHKVEHSNPIKDLTDEQLEAMIEYL